MNVAEIRSLAAQVGAQTVNSSDLKFVELIRGARASANAMLNMSQAQCEYAPSAAAKAGLASALELVRTVERQAAIIQQVFA